MRADIVTGAVFPDYELSVLERCRPDWDIGRAEQRAAWAKGEKAGFHPYGKTRAQVLAELD